MDILTYRPNKTNTIYAAYLGSVRVGYVERRPNSWLYQTSLLRPEGGSYSGRVDSEIEARDELVKCVLHWIQCAKLRRD